MLVNIVRALVTWAIPKWPEKKSEMPKPKDHDHLAPEVSIAQVLIGLSNQGAQSLK